jgi:hypothetical protein
LAAGTPLGDGLATAEAAASTVERREEKSMRAQVLSERWRGGSLPKHAVVYSLL